MGPEGSDVEVGRTAVIIVDGVAVPGSIVEVALATGKGATLESSGVEIGATSDETGVGSAVGTAEVAAGEETSAGVAEEGAASTAALVEDGAAVEAAGVLEALLGAGAAAGAPEMLPKSRSWGFASVPPAMRAGPGAG